MSKQAEEKALKAFDHYTAENIDEVIKARALFRKGYERAEEDLGWHSVDESLPPMDEEVIVLTNVINGRAVEPARYICFGHIVNKEYAVDYDGWNIPGVKYWMSCPKLPED